MAMRALCLSVAVALGSLAASPLAAQADSGEAAATPAEEPLTAERIIEVAQERLRPPGVRRPCKLSEGNEIVVCARDPDALRVESPTEEAIRKGEAMKDGVPRAPNVDGPGIFQGRGMRIGKAPVQPLIVDLTNEPQPLSEEDAQRVYRVEDGPPREPPPTPAAAALPAP
jgi:hypothetical protein